MESSTVEYRFKIIIDGVVCAEFAEMSGKGQRDEPSETRSATNGGVLSLLSQDVQITLKRGRSTDKEFVSWIASSGTNRAVRKTISVVLFDKSRGGRIAAWELTAAWPVKYDKADCEVSENEAAFESIQLAHKGIKDIETENNVV